MLTRICFAPLRWFCRTLMHVGHHLGLNRRDLAVFAWAGVGFFALTEPAGGFNRLWNVFYIILIGAHLVLLTHMDTALAGGTMKDDPSTKFNRLLYGLLWIVASALTVATWMVAREEHVAFEPTSLDLWCAAVGVGLFLVDDDEDWGIPLVKRAADAVASVVRTVTPVGVNG